jgi:ribonuclease BN (tRNA processing enzyme)
VKLTVVGCAGSFPTAASPGSCYLLEHDGHQLVLDLGNGALGSLQEYVDVDDPAALDAVVLSHCHVDHCADVASLYVQRNYHPTTRFAPLPLLGPSDTAERIAGVYGMTDPAQLSAVFEVRRFEDAPVTIGPFEIRTARAAHPVPAHIVRVSAGGASITYSGDTGPTPALVDLAGGTDIALFEASCVGEGNPPDLHMTGAEAGRAAEDADVGLLLLTHLVAWNEEADVVAEATGAFSGPIEVAHPGMTITL